MNRPPIKIEAAIWGDLPEQSQQHLMRLRDEADSAGRIPAGHSFELYRPPETIHVPVRANPNWQCPTCWGIYELDNPGGNRQPNIGRLLIGYLTEETAKRLEREINRRVEAV